MGKRAVEINDCLYRRSQAKAAQEDTVLGEVIETCLRAWLGLDPESEGTITLARETTYVVQPEDTLAKIAKEMYGDAEHYTLIAEYNGIEDTDQIKVGIRLRIPYAVEVPASAYATAQCLRYPLDEVETPYFRFGDLYPSTSQWAGKPHPGVDFHDHEGANVYAIGEGVVVVNRNDPTGYGHYLMIEHTLLTGEKIYSLYAHLAHDGASYTTPPVGTEIRGQDVVIGIEGETGYAGVPHVHFEIKATSELGLYAVINPHNLDDYFYDPYTFIEDLNNLYVPRNGTSAPADP
jgi:hypothetical protein